MKTLSITYTFNLEDTRKEVFRLEIDSETLQLAGLEKQSYPEWAKCDFCRCAHCPLSCETHEYCPLAASISDVVTNFHNILSYHEIFLQVETDERMVSQKTTAQRALGSFLGVVMAVSGCPHTAYFRPMARFHLPLASEEETIYRSASMYLLAQYFKFRESGVSDFSLKGLEEIYLNIQKVNTSIVDRLRSASKTDSSVNAVIMLDMHAKIMPYVIEDSLEDVRYLFAPYLK